MIFCELMLVNFNTLLKSWALTVGLFHKQGIGFNNVITVYSCTL